MNCFKLSFNLFFVLFFLFCYSCTHNTYGEKRISDPQIVHKIVPGTSTMDDVRSIIGGPKEITFSHGNEVWHYYYHEMSGFIITNLSQYNTTILFDDMGVVERVTPVTKN